MAEATSLGESQALPSGTALGCAGTEPQNSCVRFCAARVGGRKEESWRVTQREAGLGLEGQRVLTTQVFIWGPWPGSRPFVREEQGRAKHG